MTDPTPSASIDPAERERPTWRCFHCDEVFTDRAEAQDHFGPSEQQIPACFIDVRHVRWLEEQHRRNVEDDTEALRTIRGLAGEHEKLRRRAEEQGYARGLADAKKHPEELGLAALSSSPQGSAERDAARYRVLRAEHEVSLGVIFFGNGYVNKSIEDIEARIDARLPALASPAALVEQPSAPVALKIVLDGPPSHDGGRFVEIEDANGKSFNAGEWKQRTDGLWELRVGARHLAAHPVRESPAGLSWSGFNVYGDAASIAEVRRLLHGQDRISYFEALHRDSPAVAAPPEPLAWFVDANEHATWTMKPDWFQVWPGDPMWSDNWKRYPLRAPAEQPTDTQDSGEKPAPMTKEWCRDYPGSAAYIINELARQLDSVHPVGAPASPLPLTGACGAGSGV